MMFYYRKFIFILLKIGLDGEAVIALALRVILIGSRIKFKKVAKLLKSDRFGLKIQIPGMPLISKSV